MKAAVIYLHRIADIPSLKLSRPFPKIATQCIHPRTGFFLRMFALNCVMRSTGGQQSKNFLDKIVTTVLEKIKKKERVL